MALSHTWSLTAAADSIVGTSGNDTINGLLAINPANATAEIQTLTALDSIDGGAGVDTLTTEFAGIVAALPANVTVKNVENINFLTNNAFTADITSWEGVKAVSFTNTTATGAASITTKGAESVSTKGAAAVTIIDESATAASRGSSLKAVTVEKSGGVVEIDGNAVATVNLVKQAQSVTVNATAATRELTLNLTEVTAGTVTDAEATSLVVNASGKASVGATAADGVVLTTAKAKSVTINNNADAKSAAIATSLTLEDVNIAAAETITLTGSGLTNIQDTTTVTALKSIDSTGSTGGVTVTAELGNNVSFTGGAGKDTITVVAGYNKVANLGAGDDKVTLGVADGNGLTGTGSIVGGDGRDTLVMTAANAAAATATNTLFTKKTGGVDNNVKGFEVLEIGATALATTINLANANAEGNNAFNEVVFGGLITDALTAVTINGMATGGTVTYKAAGANASILTANVSGADLGLNDVLNVKMTAETAITAGAITAANVETVNFLTDDTATTPTGVQHVATLAGNDAKTITVTGDAGIDLTAASTAVTSFDASGVTKGAVEWTSGALANAATVKAGQDGSTIDLALATKAVTFTGGDKVDTVTSGLGADTFTLGAGNDVLVIGAANQSGVTLATADKVLDWANGSNKINVSAINAGNQAFVSQTTVQDAVTASGETTLNAILTTLDAGGTIGAGEIGAFQLGGNTYVFSNVTAGVSAADDFIIQLTGEHTLTADSFILA